MMNKTKVVFYRGTRGMGIVISVSYEKDRVIFDFGAPFTPLAEVYDGTVLHRQTNAVKDALLLGRIPMVPYVFSKEDLQDIPLEAYGESDLNTAVLICHLHLDHMSEIDKVDPHIPVYIHEDGLKLLQALDECEGKKERRSYSGFRYHEEIRVGQISVMPYFSDHPCPGSSSFLIRTPDSLICYSGDIRCHGVRHEEAFAETEAIGKEKVDLLIIDSTTTSPSEFIYDEETIRELYRTPSKQCLKGCISEEGIYEAITDTLKGSDALGIINCYPRDTGMMKELIRHAEMIDRKMVFEPSYAYILYQVTGVKAAVYEDSNDRYILNGGKLRDFETVSCDTIRKNPGHYILQNSYRNILDLTDYDGIEGHYFHLFGEPLVKGQKEYQIMENMVNKLEWTFHTYTNLYSFSHCYPNHLQYVISQIDPKSIVAVHSKKPELLEPITGKQYYPEEGKEYVLENGELVEV